MFFFFTVLYGKYNINLECKIIKKKVSYMVHANNK